MASMFGGSSTTLSQAQAQAQILSKCRANQTWPKPQEQNQATTATPVLEHPSTSTNTKPTNINISSYSRRLCLCAILSVTPISFISPSSSLVALARERRTRKNIPLEEYLTTSDGLKYYDIVEGKGPVAVKGSTVQVHFDCVYLGITAVSSRESKLLAGNRIIAQPYEFKVGSLPGRERKREFVDKPNGLFSAQAAPKPPPVLYSITEGVKVGGKRTVIVPPELGYGKKGSNEIPPGATFDLNIELLQVTPSEGNRICSSA